MPEEGATGWSDTWMISSQAAHPNCMYKWMNFIVSPKANAEVAQYFGEAPAQSKACDPSTLTAAAKADGLPANPKFCDQYHAADPVVLEARVLLADAARRLRQRQYRLHGLQRLGERLDGRSRGDRGLSHVTPTEADGSR